MATEKKEPAEEMKAATETPAPTKEAQPATPTPAKVTEKPVKEAVKAEAETIRPMVYVGPSFRDLELNTFGIFSDGIPAKYRGTIYEKLFVLPEELHDARAEVGRSGSALHTLYSEALRQHDEKKEE